MKDDIEFHTNYGETTSSSLELLAAGDTIPISDVRGPLDPEVLLNFLSYHRDSYGPMNNMEKNVYAQAIRDLAELKKKPKVLRNCRLDIIIPGDRALYTRSFRCGNGENRFVVSANQDGEASKMHRTHKSSAEQWAEKNLWHYLLIFFITTVFMAVIAGVAFKLKTTPMTARLDGVLHSRIALADVSHDPYVDPNFHDYPRGKLY